MTRRGPIRRVGVWMLRLIRRAPFESAVMVVALASLDALAATRSDGAIAVFGFHGAILTGVGYRSVTHVMVVPSPQLFRPFFPSLDEQRLNEIFNRYAHVSLTRRRRPYVTRFDKIRIPIRTMSRYAATR